MGNSPGDGLHRLTLFGGRHAAFIRAIHHMSAFASIVASHHGETADAR